MPALVGLGGSGASNVIRNANSRIKLPIKLEFGTISCSARFQGFPQGNIEYEGITAIDLTEFEALYLKYIAANKIIEVDFYGIPLVVDDYGYSREHFVYDGQSHFDRYKVSLTLKGFYEKKIQEKIKVFNLVTIGAKSISIEVLAKGAGVPYKGQSFQVVIPNGADKDYAVSLAEVMEKYAPLLNSFYSYTEGVELKPFLNSAQWSFPVVTIINDGQNTIKTPTIYNQAILDLVIANTSDATSQAAPTKKEPKIEILVEEDENPTLIPENTFILKTLDSNSVNASGRKKTRKTTTLVDGTVQKELVEIFGFLYTAKDIQVGNTEAIFTAYPQDFWVLIERQELTHIYEPFTSLKLNVTAKDPATGNKVALVLHPDYAQFAAQQIGTEITFYPQVKYLTKILSTGWHYVSLENETDALETISLAENPDDASRLALYTFKKIPKETKTLYLLKPSRSLFGQQNLGNPFSVQWVNYSELEEKIKRKCEAFNITKDGRVGVLIPDVDFVEPLTVITERQEESSFRYAVHPDFDPVNNPIQYKITGLEKSNTTTRTIVNENRYKEKTTNFSSQNSKFSDIAESIIFKDSLGRPPEATTLKTQWDKKENKENNTNKATTKRYLVSTDLAETIKAGDTTVSAGEAQNIVEARNYIESQLRIEGLNNTQTSKTVTWFYPRIRDGDIIKTEQNRFESFGSERVIEVRWKLDFKGRNNKYVPLWVTTSGTELQLGVDKERTVEIVEDNSYTPGNLAGKDPQIEVTGLGGEQTLGEIIFSGPNRRKF